MLGLIVTFAISVIFQHGQPALLYLVPGTLVPLIVLAVKRGEFQLLWQGSYAMSAIEHDEILGKQEEEQHAELQPINDILIMRCIARING